MLRTVIPGYVSALLLNEQEALDKLHHLSEPLFCIFKRQNYTYKIIPLPDYCEA